jgi:6-pyruvoyltetrahydropterin/6-carboxytetrahydropterin synthase
MSKWVIDKTFEFCYGHRVWTQTLNGKYSDDLKCACRHLHGHEGKVQIFMTGAGLDATGMITDFRHLEWLKKFINLCIDHQFIIDRSDPLYNRIVGNDKLLIPVVLPGYPEYIVGHTIDLSDLIDSTPEYEYYDGLFIVNFVPTSENLSKWIADFTDFKMKDLNVAVSQVDWWETPKSRSCYIRDTAVFEHGVRQ